ncbi:MAG: GxxExxY protein [Deltaproteobacteria bacterium]|nr:GxxExxY protein [Deltaproteobacteria bacterium]
MEEGSNHRDTEFERSEEEFLHKEITQAILGAAIEVHRTLGPGLLELVYEEALFAELTARGIRVRRQVEIPIKYKGSVLSGTYRLDLIVDESVVVELKAVEELLAVHRAQLMTYLKMSGTRVGLLINFNVPILKRGIMRIAL